MLYCKIPENCYDFFFICSSSSCDLFGVWIWCFWLIPLNRLLEGPPNSGKYFFDLGTCLAPLPQHEVLMAADSTRRHLTQMDESPEWSVPVSFFWMDKQRRNMWNIWRQKDFLKCFLLSSSILFFHLLLWFFYLVFSSVQHVNERDVKAVRIYSGFKSTSFEKQ